MLVSAAPSRLGALVALVTRALLKPFLLSLLLTGITKIFKMEDSNTGFFALLPILLLVYSIFSIVKKERRQQIPFILGEFDAISMLHNEVENYDRSPGQRVWAINLLAKQKDARAVAILEKILKKDYENEPVREAALSALRQINDQQTGKPHRPEDLIGQSREISLSIRTWSHEQAKDWWKQHQDRANDAICDGCNESISIDEGYLLASWMRCENCMNSALCEMDWYSVLASKSKAEKIERIRHFFDPKIPDKILEHHL
jgi:hypothetical protein